MAVRLETISDLLDQKEWSACSNLIARAFADSEWSSDEKAFVNFAQCRCLSNLERWSDALQPGQLAVFLAEEAKDYDLFGRAVLELAWVQHKIPGMERWAPETQRRFFAYFDRYKATRDRYLRAHLNLGVYLRAAGLFGEAFEQFKSTYLDARKRGEHDLAHLARSYSVWEALRLERTSDAEDLIKQGETYRSTDQRLRASHQLDVAQLAFLKGNSILACEQALQAAVQCRQYPDLLALAMEIVQKVADREGDGELAIIATVIAKIQAESDDRHDIVASVRGSMRNLALRYPAAMERLMATIDGPQKNVGGM